jgi:putative phage-type endonuclease
MKRDYLGSSDAAALLGVDPWKTEEDVLKRVVHGIEPEHDEKKLLMFRLGKRLEKPTLEEFAHQTGLELAFPGLIKHPEHSFIGTTVDALSSDGGCVEAKTSLAFVNAARKWDGGVPENYRTQCAHHMAVTGAKHCWVPVLFGTHRFEVLRVERDEEFIRDLIAIEVHFWNSRIVPALKEKAA